MEYSNMWKMKAVVGNNTIYVNEVMKGNNTNMWIKLS